MSTLSGSSSNTWITLPMPLVDPCRNRSLDPFCTSSGWRRKRKMTEPLSCSCGPSRDREADCPAHTTLHGTLLRWSEPMVTGTKLQLSMGPTGQWRGSAYVTHTQQQCGALSDDALGEQTTNNDAVVYVENLVYLELCRLLLREGKSMT
ncbi:hypothetical protein E2C01_007362 [Portunus trituberculatus]|uniref:Uncharacterized protein n=1 Tax=Portunus trituberculatus TaxID=210409 RepID=A0A5B7CZZ8_PORTR|nr:hypothetical protein [Portunus trituberculatus]